MSARKGFTLIELMVVIAIIGILSAIGMAAYSGVQKNARLARRVSDLQSIYSALELYRSDNDHYPESTDWSSECSGYGDKSPNDVIPGLVPKYLQSFPIDPQMNKTDNTYCYMYKSLAGGAGYKIIDYKIDEFTPADYTRARGLTDPARDGGADSCKVDGDSPEAWGFYTYNACAL